MRIIFTIKHSHKYDGLTLLQTALQNLLDSGVSACAATYCIGGTVRPCIVTECYNAQDVQATHSFLISRQVDTFTTWLHNNAVMYSKHGFTPYYVQPTDNKPTTDWLCLEEQFYSFKVTV